MPHRGLAVSRDESHLPALLQGCSPSRGGARPHGVAVREGRGFTISSAHLPVPDVGGQHLVLLILWAEEGTVSARGVLALWTSVPRGRCTPSTAPLGTDASARAAALTPCVG